MSEEMQQIDPVTAAMLMGQIPDPCEPIIEISHKELTRLMDVVEFGDQLERVEKDRLLAHLKDVLAEDQPELWAMHSPGPGEVHPMISKEEAERQTSELLALFKERFPTTPITVNVIPSPFSPLEHFEILAGELNDQVTNLREALEKKTTDTPAAKPQAIVLPMPVMPEQPEDAIDDSWMDGYNAAQRMREECVRAIEAADLAAPAAPAADAWIPVSDRLPSDTCEPVWCHGTYEDQHAPCGFEGVYRHGRWVCLNNGDYIDGGYGSDYEAQVTHWMPLPAAPAARAQEGDE